MVGSIAGTGHFQQVADGDAEPARCADTPAADWVVYTDQGRVQLHQPERQEFRVAELEFAVNQSVYPQLPDTGILAGYRERDVGDVEVGNWSEERRQPGFREPRRIRR